MSQRDNISITIANADDIDDIVKIERRCFPFDAWSSNAFMETLFLDGGNIFIAKIDDITIGYLVANAIYNEAEVYNIAVDMPYRRMGIASYLMQFFESNISSDIDNIFLEVREKNNSAKSLYADLGFEEISIRKNYYHSPIDNAIIMRKCLRK